MSNQITAIMKARKKETARVNKIKLRKHLNADALFASMRAGFTKIKDHRPGKAQHTLADTLMSGFAMFSLKDPSLLVFDERRFDEPQNLKTIYGMSTIPCDTSMREILDEEFILITSDRCLKMVFVHCNGVRYSKKCFLWKTVICSTLTVLSILLPRHCILMPAIKK